MAKNSGNPGDIGMLPGYTMDPRAGTAEGSAGSSQYGAGSVQAHQDAVSPTVVGSAFDNNGDPFKSAQAPAGQISVYTGDSQEPGQLHEAISGQGPDTVAETGAGRGHANHFRQPNASTARY